MTKAENKIAAHNKKNNHLLMCYKAEICPDCGDELKLEIDKAKCPNGHVLNSLWGCRDVSDVGSIVWSGSIGEIGKYHRDNYGSDE